MKKYTARMVVGLYTAFLIGCLVTTIGKAEPAYIFTLAACIKGIILFGLLIYMGYKAGQESVRSKIYE